MSKQAGLTRPSVMVVILGIGLLALVIIGGRQVWQVRAKHAAVGHQVINCSEPLALSLADTYELYPLQSCFIEKFVTNTNEHISLVHIRYGDDKECTTRCFHGLKSLFVKDPDRVIKVVADAYVEPDLSMGLRNQACHELWTNDLAAILLNDPTHIKKSLIKERNDYKWQFTLTNFSGQAPGDPKPPKCVRTGILTTNLEGRDWTVVGAPDIQIK